MRLKKPWKSFPPGLNSQKMLHYYYQAKVLAGQGQGVFIVTILMLDQKNNILKS
jgi:hypothetical protein